MENLARLQWGCFVSSRDTRNRNLETCSQKGLGGHVTQCYLPAFAPSWCPGDLWVSVSGLALGVPALLARGSRYCPLHASAWIAKGAA